MYNSQNLPLSSKKIIKKTITRYIKWFWFLLLFIFPILFGFYSSLTMEKSTCSMLPPSMPSSYCGQPGTSPIPKIILAALLSVVILLIPILIYEYFYYRLYYYEFTEDKATIRKGVVSRATGLIRYERLQNIYIDQDFLDRIFGLYDVHYETAGEKSGFYSHVDGLNKENADKLVSFLEEKTRQPMPVQKVSGGIAQLEVNQEEVKGGEISIREYPLSEAVIISMTIGWIFILSLMTFWIPLIFRSIVIFLFGFPAILIISFVYSWVWYKNFYFNFSQDKGEIRSKVIGQSVSYLYYDRIQNINVSQSLFDRLFGIFTITIVTAGERAGMRLVINGLPRESAEKIKDFLLAKSKYYRGGL